MPCESTIKEQLRETVSVHKMEINPKMVIFLLIIIILILLGVNLPKLIGDIIFGFFILFIVGYILISISGNDNQAHENKTDVANAGLVDQSE